MKAKKPIKTKVKKTVKKTIVVEPEPEIILSDAQGIGRPVKFKNKEALQVKIQEYFDTCASHKAYRKAFKPMVTRQYKNQKGEIVTEDIPAITGKDIASHWIDVDEPYMTEQEPLTITGLAIFLGTTRNYLVEYSHKDEFSHTIRTAKEIIHQFAEKSLWREKVSPVGIIFNLKNNWGWRDQIETLTKVAPTGKEHLTDEALDLEIESKNRENGIKGT